MLSQVLQENKIIQRSHISDWQEAITVAAGPLLSKKSIEDRYVNAMIQGVLDLGPYIVIAPNIALAHARPTDGVIHTDLSLLIVNEPVSFSNDAEHDCQIIFVLAAKDSKSHLDMLVQLSEFLSQEEQVYQLVNAENPVKMMQVIQKWEGIS